MLLAHLCSAFPPLEQPMPAIQTGYEMDVDSTIDGFQQAVVQHAQRLYFPGLPIVPLETMTARVIADAVWQRVRYERVRSELVERALNLLKDVHAWNLRTDISNYDVVGFTDALSKLAVRYSDIPNYLAAHPHLRTSHLHDMKRVIGQLNVIAVAIHREPSQALFMQYVKDAAKEISGLKDRMRLCRF